MPIITEVIVKEVICDMCGKTCWNETYVDEYDSFLSPPDPYRFTNMEEESIGADFIYEIVYLCDHCQSKIYNIIKNTAKDK